VIRTRPNCRNAPSILSIGRIGSQKSEFAQGRCLIENLSELISTLRGPARPMTPLAKHQLAQALHSQLPRCQTRREGSDPGRLRQGDRLPPELRHRPPPPRATPTETGAAGPPRPLWCPGRGDPAPPLGGLGLPVQQAPAPLPGPPPSHDRALRRTHTLAPGQDRPRADERRHHRSQSSPPIGGTPSPAA